ncbi:MAG TPA: crotonase/enoyl-CoA hydratase family protein [Polyangiaceae bacterium]|nr:crotonase/enoyl-CoA hydratase family protein [Polyangiaceae bacterium]
MTAPTNQRVTVTVQDGIADVRLSRAEKLNALDPEMFTALVRAGEQLMNDASLRAVVLSGEGRAFCAGLDFQSFLGGGSPGDFFARDANSPANRAQRVAWIWQELPVPVIAVVHGVAFGGGLQIALGADMRYATADAKLSIMEVRWGLVPDMTGTQTLRHLMRLDVLKELTFTGRVVSGSEGQALGLVTRVCDDPRAAAFETAREIAQKSPDAVRSAKQLLNASGVVSIAEGLSLEAKLQKALLGSPNQLEAVMANFEKRDPKFKV